MSEFLPASLGSLISRQSVDFQNLALGIYDVSVKRSIVSLNRAQIRALPTAPQQLVPTVAPNQIIVPFNAVAWLQSTAAYTNIDATANMFLGTPGTRSTLMDLLDEASGTNQGSYGGLVSNFLGTGANQLMISFGNGLFNAAYAPYLFAYSYPDHFLTNDKLSLLLVNGASGNLTGGGANDKMVITTWYDIITLE